MEKKKTQQEGQGKAKAVTVKVAVKADNKSAVREIGLEAVKRMATTDEKIKFLKALRIRTHNSRRDIYAEIMELRLAKADFNTMVRLVLGCTEITAEHAEWLTMAVEKEALRRVIAARL